jgi:tetratricopeptide (TPR) repeat protein
LLGVALPGLAREETAVFQYEKPVAATQRFSATEVAVAQTRSRPARPVTPTPERSGSVAMTATDGFADEPDFAYDLLPSPIAASSGDGDAALPDSDVREVSAVATETPLSAKMPPQVPSPLQQAQRRVQSGDIRGALASLEPAAAQPLPAEEQLDVLYMKGMLLLADGDTEGAKQVFSELVSNFPTLPEPHNNLAAIYASEGDLETARALLEDLLEENPDYVVGLENLGDIYTKLAADNYRKAQDLKPAHETVALKLKLLDKLFEPTI